MNTYNVTIISSFTKKRINSKKWDLIGCDYVKGIPGLIDAEKFRTTHKVITDIPESVDIETVYKYWGAVDITMVPLFFVNDLRLGVSWSDLISDVAPKLEGKTDFCSINLNPLTIEDQTND